MTVVCLYEIQFEPQKGYFHYILATTNIDIISQEIRLII